MTTPEDARAASPVSIRCTIGHSLLAAAWSCALALMPFVAWSLLSAPGPFETWTWRSTLALGLAAAYVLAGGVIGLLIGVFFGLLGLGRSWSPAIAGGLSGALALAVWTRPVVSAAE